MHMVCCLRERVHMQTCWVHMRICWWARRRSLARRVELSLVWVAAGK